MCNPAQRGVVDLTGVIASLSRGTSQPPCLVYKSRSSGVRLPQIIEEGAELVLKPINPPHIFQMSDPLPVMRPPGARPYEGHD